MGFRPSLALIPPPTFALLLNPPPAAFRPPGEIGLATDRALCPGRVEKTSTARGGRAATALWLPRVQQRAGVPPGLAARVEQGSMPGGGAGKLFTA